MPVVSTADTLRIGAILPLTGYSASNWKNMNDGLQLAVDEINKRGGVNGSKIELIVEDGKSDPRAAVAGFDRSEAARQPFCYVSYLSSVGMALAPLAEEKQVVLLGFVTSATDFTQERERVFLLTGLLEDRKVSRKAVRDVLAAGFEYSEVFGNLRVRPGEHDMTFPFCPVQIVHGSLKHR